NVIEAEVMVNENPFALPLDKLFTMAARINKKRSFLFVSKLIGKHIPINPQKGLVTSALLAARYYQIITGKKYEQCEELLHSFLTDKPYRHQKPFIPESSNPLIIGFAETATALGHAFFDCFERADYFHTTREEIRSKSPVITFEEEHSHATSHRCYISKPLIKNDREIILVDDELTTGKTVLNIIQSIHSKFPRKKYSVVSILDWRSTENKQEFKRLEASLSIKIEVISLIGGSVKIKQLKELPAAHVENRTISIVEPKLEFLSLSTPYSEIIPSYIKETGRFGIGSHERTQIYQKIIQTARFLSEKRTGNKTLCLGTGEFMYIPMKIASEMSEGVSFQSTTRSPIYISNEKNYGVRFGATFPNPEDMTVSHFVYNIPKNYYDDLFLFFEREVDDESLEGILEALKLTQIKSIKIVFFAKKEVSVYE
ncbi:MAG TPA: phosphoribosyltransferase family protein, partial [Bacillales bacterium]|nr:phosphoribosyltransferase family protein [Bacillales bacterium]